MILSHREIEQRIKDGEIAIYYSFLPASDDPKKIDFLEDALPVKLDDPTSRATAFFKKMIYSDNLSLTLGPIAKTHGVKSIRSRRTFNDYEKTIDLRLHQNELIIEPFETVSIATNERIKLCGNTVAIIIPKVTTTDAGVILVPSYIDPHYNGILRLVIMNTTGYRQSLKILETIGKCFFLSTDREISSDYKDDFPEKSIYVGQNWRRIISEGGNPFPRKKQPVVPRTMRDRLRQQYIIRRDDIQRNLFTLSTLLLLITLFMSAGRFQETITNLNQLQDSVEISTQKISEIDSKLSGIIQRSGSSEVEIRAGQLEGRNVVLLGIPRKDLSSAWLQVNQAYYDPANISLSYNILSGSSPTDSALEIRVNIKQAQIQDIKVPVLWMLQE